MNKKYYSQMPMNAFFDLLENHTIPLHADIVTFLDGKVKRPAPYQFRTAFETMGFSTNGRVNEKGRDLFSASGRDLKNKLNEGLKHGYPELFRYGKIRDAQEIRSFFETLKGSGMYQRSLERFFVRLAEHVGHVIPEAPSIKRVEAKTEVYSTNPLEAIAKVMPEPGSALGKDDREHWVALFNMALDAAYTVES